MGNLTRVGIAGTGSYLPKRAVPNKYFEDFIETSDEWIRQRTGIEERRWAGDDEPNSFMCTEAAKRALDDAGLQPSDVDCIVLGTVSPDRMLPAVSPQVQANLGIEKTGAFDVVAACNGFVTALNTAYALVASGTAKRVLAIGAERLSSFVDLQDRGSCILFGDGAGAAVVTPFDECQQGEILRTQLGTDGSGRDFIYMDAGGSTRPPTHDTIEAREHFIRVQGREVYRFAVSTMTQIVADMLEGYDRDELGMLVPHQVNQRIIDAAVERLGIPEEKVFVNIQKYGNTSAASVPIALDEANRGGKLPSGKLVVMCAFGAGLSWGGTLLRW
ncbi:MAG: ketoacyl-ACP synthase III [Planctomycetes bacterium]|nr:ketoacyl-ACP synthase III [Planctomycetota bacterium]MCB9903987.1 ketoacyl-ACP synthase III [Planctomycetota bacterium]